MGTTKTVQQKIPKGKFSPNWEGTFVIRVASESTYCTLGTMQGESHKMLYNVKWLKHYYW
ncbi:hypothetical protein BVC80_7263g1 [Macleaya cordata]|uniref:Uncharacterized protein n=1 Tax=Macleaya cordata TaxID=56857 RepID=A0A200PME9_MACCD|nr:hypothetical protein BVC80_7263g1 [Macleaya cordata]